ncbi:MAG TPA: ATP-binding protein [Ornithinimicrobium sp.]|uniref:sensor histidine kinase n=1 Tax=Ornithinimicrobium sp. TaxID=1977084 RepID=UPI002B493CA9|nr:ATP-binding protein [Ornithinimicrobium sp.]HKJ12992.1 ATP-binding protein [Ornithinimicrobium sp.]
MPSAASTLLPTLVLLAVLVGVGVLLTSRRSRQGGAPRQAPAVAEGAAPADAAEDQTRLADGVSELLEATRSGGLVVGRDGRVVRATSSALTFGLVRGNDIVHAGLKELFSQVRADGRPRESELESARGPLGEGRLLIGARVVSISDGLILILVEDRTQARRVEEVRRDFVVNVSHELKTPVGGLSLLAEAVEDAADDPEAVRRFSSRMKVEAQRLTRLVSEIVDLSRLQTADLTTELVLVDVSTCADDAVEQTRLIAGERSVTSRVASAAEGLRVYGDPELITTAIRNLVTNAIAYSEDGTKVSVITRRAEDTVEVKVSDQGRGISASDQRRIFERFYRVDPARSRMTGGTGLGLSIVKHICAGLGGEVTLWSQEGQGSTFTIRLPGVVDDDSPVGSQVPDHRRPAARKVTI